ncbi:hypothetical protein D3P96_04925 [Weissella viridescens]|uniref:Uncharacterized protein n=1 Tax=Weissella viridescens TaxID=1629 RepID=A0A3P2REY6_WEIVI|nr:hypothetical protein D3P96_04925 [Weissella viridescens]
MFGVKRSGYVLSECLLCLLLVIGIVLPLGNAIRQEARQVRQARQACQKVRQAYLKKEMDWYVQVQKR